jgi:hypothetical protein
MVRVQREGAKMRSIAIMVLAFAVVACTEDDRRHLLTYEHPRSEAKVAMQSPAPEPAIQAPENAVPPPVQTAPVSPPPPVTAPQVVEAAPLAAPADVVTASPSQTEEAVPLPRATPPAVPAAPASSAFQASEVVNAPAPAPVEIAPAPPPQIVVVRGPEQPAEAMMAPPPPRRSAPVAESTIPAIPAPMPTATAQARLSPATEAHCRSVAQQRKDDAAANEYDDDMQEQIYKGTFTNCMNWAQQHS